MVRLELIVEGMTLFDETPIGVAEFGWRKKMMVSLARSRGFIYQIRETNLNPPIRKQHLLSINDLQKIEAAVERGSYTYKIMGIKYGVHKSTIQKNLKRLKAA